MSSLSHSGLLLALCPALGCSLILDGGSGTGEPPTGEVCPLGRFEPSDARSLPILLTGAGLAAELGYPSLPDDESSLYFELVGADSVPRLWWVEQFDAGADALAGSRHPSGVQGSPGARFNPIVGPDQQSLYYARYDLDEQTYVPRRLDLALGQPGLDLGGGFDEFFASEYRGRFNGDGVVVAPPNDESVVFDYNGDDGIFEVQCAAGSCGPDTLVFDGGFNPFVRDDGRLVVFHRPEGIYAGLRSGPGEPVTPTLLWEGQPEVAFSTAWLSKDRCRLYFAEAVAGSPTTLWLADKSP
ncbi:MAG: hypothetical protein KJO07_10900 [Deltaproteobacteria bacterium]|nr:hypothetical protein [Deltaproteobacteria bacterium]